MNWGIRILLILITIVVGTVSVGIYMVSQDTDSLDEEGYYEKGLDYESVIVHQRNVLRDKAEPVITLQDQYIEVVFKTGGNQGEIVLKRPSNQELDRIIPFSTSGETYTLSRKDIEAGAWEVQLNWTSVEVPYYHQQKLYIP